MTYENESKTASFPSDIVEGFENVFKEPNWFGRKWFYIKRFFKYSYQKITRGWSDRDTWNLDHTIAEFAYPRVIRYKQKTNGHPYGTTWEEWMNILDDIIYALKICKDEWKLEDADVDWLRVQKGLALFGTHFRNLWW